MQHTGGAGAWLLTRRASAKETSELADRLAADPHRPRYHFLPPAHWMNDPNGPIFHGGGYHMFYQHNPNGAFWGTMHWGHAVSRDMVHWKHLPVALAPAAGGPDKDGVFSGCAVINRGVPTLIYTGVSPEVQCLATSNDEMIEWKRHPRNPVIASPPQGLEVTGFRDPCVWWESDLWHMLVGSGFKRVGGTVLLYTSDDLVKWTYHHPLVVGNMDAQSRGDNPVATGEMWECPDFFPLDGKHVLIVSTQGTVRYFVGTYAERKFHPEREGRIDFGAYYAPKSMLDANGRRILWGWILERRTDAAQRAAGWSGVLSLPRVLRLGSSGALEMSPAAELEMLRGKRQSFERLRSKAEGSAPLKGVSGEQLEIAAEFDPGDAEEFGLCVRCAADASEETRILFDRKNQRLQVDSRKSSLSPETRRELSVGTLQLTAGEPLRLRVFLDGSVIEVFANGRACLTARTYPTRADSVGVDLVARGGVATLRSCDVWELRPISKDRLTS
jgi:beta-fructofuranosidase